MGKGSIDSRSLKFLHGDLDIWILEATSLPNMDITTERVKKFCTKYGAYSSPFAKPKPDSHKGVSKIITCDPYVSVCVSGATIAQTRVISNSENPEWEEHFCVPVAHPALKVEFQVKDNDVFGAKLIGVASIGIERIISGLPLTGWFPIVDPDGNVTRTFPELHLSLQFKTVDCNPVYHDGVGAGPDYVGVPNAYFPLHKQGNVTLYQDAHVPTDMLPKVELDNGKIFEPNKCWEDICHAIVEAHHLIYIIGWSIFHRVRLVREPTRPLPNGGELCLGDLLKHKTQEGVHVVMLIWDDKTSHDKFLLKTDGVMHTHDEETRRFFKHSGVYCVLTPRYASTKLSIFKQQVVGTLFTHHQKCVILDTQASGNNRKITAFIGGLDLCDGRYDTPEHRLFNDLDTVFQKDVHNPTFQGSNSQGPRQPWHDLHCKVEGPAAHDILTNFEQRWRRTTKWRDFKRKVAHRHDDALVKTSHISWILSPSSYGSDSQMIAENDPENWHVQIFRSIDSGSVKGFPKIVHEAERKNLVCAKNLMIDKSIHSAYVKAIRSAQHFIYVENQYFIGSAYCWPSYKNAGADNLIPMELSLKIVSKIQAKERFAVYVVIPMWPEGIPTSSAVQEILFWQGQTMSLMYRVIADALKEANLSDVYHPQDYLNFYCLGKCERTTTPTSGKSTICFQDAQQRLAQKFRRFMIYVHSKGMIVDDEYVIIGSANINQRSMEGSRDTEIAMGAYQPHYRWTGKNNTNPHGQVYGYRMSLWAEHMGELKECFKEPGSLDCVRYVNELSESNWQTYCSPEVEEMKGHLMRYPLKVSSDGKVASLPGAETFPDVGGKILGAHSTLPVVLTT